MTLLEGDFIDKVEREESFKHSKSNQRWWNEGNSIPHSIQTTVRERKMTRTNNWFDDECERVLGGERRSGGGEEGERTMMRCWDIIFFRITSNYTFQEKNMKICHSA